MSTTIAAAHGLPTSALDPYSPEFLNDPFPSHEKLRDLGPVVWLEHYGVCAMARHKEVHSTLNDWQSFSSSAGVGISDYRKETPWRKPSIILEVDPPVHTRTRAVLSRVLSRRVLESLRETFVTAAQIMVDRLVCAGSFDGMRSYISRFGDISELEDWIAAGIPVIISAPWELLEPGRPRASNGHLVV